MPGRPRTWDTIPEMVLSTAERHGGAEARPSAVATSASPSKS
jgi:hypothetical protein